MSDESEALARNDRYLHEFVEEHDLCPFARRCRETNALERRVFSQTDLSLDAALKVIGELSTDTFAHVEVALLVFPSVHCTFAEFERFAASVRQARSREERSPTYFIVPFHPDSPPDVADPGRTVSFLRRSPDPTLQLVRAALLDRVRGGIDPEDTVYVDPAEHDFTKPLPAVEKPKSLSTRIAETNHETVQRETPEKLRALLDSMRRR